MARHVWEIPINADTSREDLARCILEAALTSDTNVTQAAANAQAELARREREEWAARFNAQESSRVKAQKVQEAQIARQIKVQEKLMGQQLDVAKEQANAAKQSAQAARQSAQATERSAKATVGLVWITGGLVIVTAILAAIQLFSG